LIEQIITLNKSINGALLKTNKSNSKLTAALEQVVKKQWLEMTTASSQSRS